MEEVIGVKKDESSVHPMAWLAPNSAFLWPQSTAIGFGWNVEHSLESGHRGSHTALDASRGPLREYTSEIDVRCRP